MILSVLYGLFFWFIILCSTPFTFLPLRILKVLGFKDSYWNSLSALAKIYTGTIFWATRARVEVFGREKIPSNRNLCIISNHQAYADILTLMNIMPRVPGFIAKKELGRIPLLRDWMIGVGCYFMDRKNVRDGLNAILYGVKRIKEGYPMVIFPEGTRSKGAQMGDFKKGSLKLATKSKAIIVPISINGTYKLLEETGRVKRCHIQVLIHDPIDAGGLSSAEEDALPDRVHSLIQAGVDELEAKRNR